MKRFLISGVLSGMLFLLVSALSGVGFIALICGIVFFVAVILLPAPKPKEEKAIEGPVEYVPLTKPVADERWLKAQMPLVELRALCTAIETPAIQPQVKSIYQTAQKMVEAVDEKPERKDKAMRFFENHLETLVSILKRYDEIENRRLDSPEIRDFMEKTRQFTVDIDGAFTRQLHALYSDDVLDATIDMDLMKTLLKGEGLIENSDFSIGGTKTES